MRLFKTLCACVCVNTFTWHSLSFVIFYENKLDPRLFFDETALELSKKALNIWYVKAKIAPSTERQFPILTTLLK